MTAQIDYEKLLYDRSAGTLRVHGIMSVIFGSLGILVALLFTTLMVIGSMAEDSYDSYDSSIAGLSIVGMVIFIFWTLPHIYLVVAGYYLMREPAPRVAKALVLVNLVIGTFWNLILLVLSIINLTQLGDYDRGYSAHKHVK